MKIHPIKKVPESWDISFGSINFIIKPSAFKHVGIFPEHLSNWTWLREKINNNIKPEREINVLNLFGYTGGATIACAQAGAKVTHVDSSKSSVTSANQNAKASGLGMDSIRWILEDAYEFVKKEVKRGKTYDGIIMDPPSFGHGTDGEVWQLEKQFTDLVSDCFKLLSAEPIFFLINGYAAGYSSISYANNMITLVDKFQGSIEHGELTIKESLGGRLLPAGIFARWSK